MSHIPYYGEDWDILTGRREERPEEKVSQEERPTLATPKAQDDELFAYA